MKMKARTPYTAEFKREALAMVASSGQTLPEVARALSVSLTFSPETVAI